MPLLSELAGMVEEVTPILRPLLIKLLGKLKKGGLERSAGFGFSLS